MHAGHGKRKSAGQISKRHNGMIEVKHVLVHDIEAPFTKKPGAIEHPA